MSNEFDSQITESVAKDKILNFYHKKKYYLFIGLLLVVCLPISYQIFLSFDERKHALELEKYSEVILNSKNKESDIKKLLKSDSETVSLLALNKLVETNKNSKDTILFFDELINSKKIADKTRNLVKIKKAIFIKGE